MYYETDIYDIGYTARKIFFGLLFLAGIAFAGISVYKTINPQIETINTEVQSEQMEIIEEKPFQALVSVSPERLQFPEQNTEPTAELNIIDNTATNMVAVEKAVDKQQKVEHNSQSVATAPQDPDKKTISRIVITNPAASNALFKARQGAIIAETNKGTFIAVFESHNIHWYSKGKSPIILSELQIPSQQSEAMLKTSLNASIGEAIDVDKYSFVFSQEFADKMVSAVEKIERDGQVRGCISRKLEFITHQTKQCQ